MPVKDVKLKVSPPLRAVRAYLLPIERHMKNLSIPLKKSSIFLDQWVQRNFVDEGKRLGVDRWKQFKAVGPTGSRGRWIKKTKGKPRYFDATAKLLRDTRQLSLSMKPFFTKNDAGIGSALKYSPAHEFGLPARKLPARRMLPKDKEVEGDIEEIFVNHISDAIAKGRFPFKRASR